MLRLDTSQPALIRALLCTKRTNLQQITVRLEMNNVRVLELNVTPKFALMKQSELNVNSAQSTMSASSSNINKCFGVANLFTHKSSKINKYFVPLFLTNLYIQSLHLEQTRDFKSFFA